ncbi:diacylglycerol kinase family protein [bacterium]|nr:diacylglycerol kinase family protein [bacterium]
MTKFKSSSVKKSFSNAIRGLKLALFSQRNFRIEVIIAFIVVIAALCLKVSHSDLCILIIMIAIVLICELLNSIIEFTLDAVYRNHYSKLVEMAKDMSAGMVLFVSMISVVIGLIVFVPYIKELFT